MIMYGEESEYLSAGIINPLLTGCEMFLSLPRPSKSNSSKHSEYFSQIKEI